jgi:hypothetical protein
MTELEMDLAKNQYETQPEMSQQQRGEAESEALKRLRELAKRQEQLARESARQQQLTEQQKWQQEQLRREAEQLRQQLEQLAQQQSQQNGQQSSSQQGSQQANSRGQSSSQSSAAAEAARQVSEAMRQMQARNNANGAQNSEAAKNASEQLNRATEQLERGRRQATGDKFNDLARNARDLSDKQRKSEEELRAALQPTPQAPAGIARPGAQQQRSGLSYEQAERLAQTKRDIQSGLEDLQRQMRAARQQAGESAPRASERVGKAAKELDESDTGSRLARSALEIERGRGVQAATREGLISESLQQLQQGLEEAASFAANEAGEKRNGARRANPDDLLAELGDLRRAVERAKAQGMAQNGQNNGDAGTRSPDARNGQAGQSGGETGQQGQGEQGQRGQGGGQAGNQSGLAAGGRRNGGAGGPQNLGLGGGGDWSNHGQLLSGGPIGQLTQQERDALREQGQISSQRLQELREQLANGALAEADITALRELSDRLRRGGADPMSAEYPRMVTLLNQIELAALQAQRSTAKNNPTRANGTVDDSRRYRDNVAEYYRKLGGTNDEK